MLKSVNEALRSNARYRPGTGKMNAAAQGQRNRLSALTPSPGTPGEGWGEGIQHFFPAKAIALASC